MKLTASHFGGGSIRRSLVLNGHLLLSGDGLLISPASQQAGTIVALASLSAFGRTRRVTNAVRIRFAQAPELCQKRGKVGCVKQRLLAELDAFEITSFYRCVERSSADTEQVKCFADRVSCLRKT
jgi:hypothetical protein